MMENTPNNIQYNTEREEMIVPDYGRNYQVLMDYIVKIEDKEERTRAAATVVNMIAQQNPQMKNQPEYQQKMWEQVYAMSDYQLDANCPFPTPERPEEEVVDKRKIDYGNRVHKYHFYGTNVELMIKKAIEMEDGEAKEKIISAISSYMRVSYRTWNDDKVSDDVIIGHLKELSDGKIIVDKIPEMSMRAEKNFSRDNSRDHSRDNNRDNNRKQKSRNFSNRKGYRG